MTDLFIILNAFILRIFNPNPMAVIIRVRFPKLYTNIVVSVDQTLCKAESAMIELVTVEEFSVCKLVTDPILRQGAISVHGVKNNLGEATMTAGRKMRFGMMA